MKLSLEFEVITPQIGSAPYYKEGSEVWAVKFTTLNVVSPMASISLLIGSDAHHFIFTVYHHFSGLSFMAEVSF